MFQGKEIAVNLVKLDGETKNLTNLDTLKGVFAKNERGHRLDALKNAFHCYLSYFYLLHLYGENC